MSVAAALAADVGLGDGRDRYVTLIASLPTPESLFRARQTPLSRLRLEERLKGLEAEDAAELARVEDVLAWDRMALSTTDEEAAARARRALAAIREPVLAEIVQERLELRTLVAALRRRFQGEGPPEEGRPFGVGRHLRRVRDNWADPAFGLATVHPWLAEADRLMRAGDAVALQRLLFDTAWQRLKRREGEHLFDFVAVALYVLKWDIVDRWVRMNVEGARRRYADLLDEALAAHGPLELAGDG